MVVSRDYVLLNDLLKYDADTGKLTWLVNRGPARIGREAGSKHNMGYKAVRVAGKAYLCHRVAWLLSHGQWPAYHIDHKDGDKQNNSLDNLRECSPAENQQNAGFKSHNTSGFTGVWFCKATGKWHAYISNQKKRRHLGVFTSPESAHGAYLVAKKELHTFQPQPRDSNKENYATK